jgi:hypothetical protein
MEEGERQKGRKWSLSSLTSARRQFTLPERRRKERKKVFFLKFGFEKNKIFCVRSSKKCDNIS